MSQKHDLYDWLGGYPYESVEDSELQEFFRLRDFVLERSFLGSPKGIQLGVFGSGCDKNVFRRK